MTKVHIISIVIVAFLLVFIFGHNPSKYFEKKQMEAANKNLVTRIMKKSDPDYGKKPKHPKPRTTGLDFGSDTSEDKTPEEVSEDGQKGFFGTQHTANKGTFTPPNMQPANNNASGGFQAGAPGAVQKTNNASPQSISPGANTGIAPNAAPANSGDDYYPPTLSDKNKMKPQSELNLDNLFHKSGPQPLDDGRKMAFEGTKVYQVMSDGSKKPLEDGKYPMLNNSYTLVIQGGEHHIYQ